jgi:hypothetical protein
MIALQKRADAQANKSLYGLACRSRPWTQRELLMSRTYIACLEPVFNRGAAPVSFLDELVDWALKVPPDIFAPSHAHDIYSVMAGKLGPWRDLKHRTAVMLEVLRVLAG